MPIFMFKKFIETLEENLKKKLPGISAHKKMSPSNRNSQLKFLNKDVNTVDSGILILIFPINNLPHTVFIKRPEYNGPHSGQISFPGGKIENIDNNITETALREAQEEIGIKPNDVKIIGQLSKLYIPVSNINVFPKVGYISYKPNFIPDKQEVTEIIPFSIKELSNKNIIDTEQVSLQGRIIDAPFYNVNGHHVWGATAMIINEFLEIVDRRWKNEMYLLIVTVLQWAFTVSQLMFTV